MRNCITDDFQWSVRMYGRHAACDNSYHVHEPEWVLEVSTHSLLSLVSRVNNSSDVCRWCCCCCCCCRLRLASAALMRRSKWALIVFKVTACCIRTFPSYVHHDLSKRQTDLVVWLSGLWHRAVWLWLSAFRRNRLPPSSGTLLPSYQTTRCHDAADHTVVIHGVNHHRPPAVSC